jgi:hypothetical protein
MRTIRRTTALQRTLFVGLALGLALCVSACGGMTASQIRAQLHSDLLPFQRAANALKAEHPVGLARLDSDLAPMSRALDKFGSELKPLATQAPQDAVAPLKRLSAATLTLASDVKAIIKSQSILTAISNADQLKADEPGFEAAAKAAKKALG